MSFAHGEATLRGRALDPGGRSGARQRGHRNGHGAEDDEGDGQAEDSTMHRNSAFLLLRDSLS
jgi:hypothetical protein